MPSTGQGRLIRSGMASLQGLRYPIRHETANGSGLDAALGDFWWGGYPPAPTQIPYSWLSPPARWRPAPPANTAAITRTGGETAHVTNRTSVAAIGERPYTQTINSTVADDPVNFATYITTYYTTPRQRMPEIALELAGRTPTECWRILSRKIGDRISITGAPNAAAQLLANPWMESGTSPWTGQNCTVAQSPLFPRSGSNSLLLTPAGGVSVVNGLSEIVPVTAGATYTTSAWVLAPAGWSGGVTTGVNWYTAGSFSSTAFGSTVNPQAGVLTQIPTQTFTAPAGVNGGQVRLRVSGTPANTDLFYFDEVMLNGRNGTRPAWPDGVTELVIEGIAHGYGSDGGRSVTWKTAPVVGTTAGVAGPWFRLGESFTGGTDLMPF